MTFSDVVFELEDSSYATEFLLLLLNCRYTITNNVTEIFWKMHYLFDVFFVHIIESIVHS